MLECSANGFLNKEICEALNIGEDAFYRYLRRNKEFAESLNKAKIKADNQVIAAFYRRCVGFDYEETTREFTSPGKDADGNEVPPRIKSLKVTKKHMPPNVLACLAWLYNRRREHWRQRQVDGIIETPRLPEFQDMDDGELMRFIAENGGTEK